MGGGTGEADVWGEGGPEGDGAGAAAEKSADFSSQPPPQNVSALPVHQASPWPIVLAAASTGQMVLLKKLKDAERAGKRVANMHVLQPVLLASAGFCAFGGLLSALGLRKYINEKMSGGPKTNVEASAAE